jgi:hypothetical protein
MRGIHHPTARPAIARRALLGVLLLPGLARAQGDPWTVRGVAVDVAGDAVAARDRALADATRQAWEQLLPRITTPDRAAALRGLAAAELEPLTESVEIDDERVAPGRYRASMTVTFSAERVRLRLAQGAGGPGGGGPVAAIASFRGVRQWADLSRRLEASPAVARVELRVLRVAEAELTLLLTADPAAAIEGLAASGIRMEQDPAGGPFRLRLATP